MNPPGPVICTKEVLARIADSGLWFEELTRRSELSTAIYQLPPGAYDPQSAHGEDEIYFVLSGAGMLDLDGVTRMIEEGTIIDVPGGASHRFHSITDTLRLLVVFAPAFGTVEP